MKLKILLIGLALALMLCISPVAALSGDDFFISKWDANGVKMNAYRCNDMPHDEYIRIHPTGTLVLKSLVTFKPANIPDAPEMVVYTKGNFFEDSNNHPSKVILLTSVVDEWEIKYYSTYKDVTPQSLHNDKYLKNKGVVNLKEYFLEDYARCWTLLLQESLGQYIIGDSCTKWSIPDVD